VAAGTCSDGILNQGETDVDCGGPCPPCAAGQICAEAGDCAAAVCNSNPRCSGGICAQRPEPDKTSCDEGGPQTRECYSGSCLTLTSWCSWKSETSSYYYVWDESLGKYELSKFPSRCECNCWGLTYWIGGWPTSDECKRCTRNSNNTENYCWN
jgi:hypothetical protein